MNPDSYNNMEKFLQKYWIEGMTVLDVGSWKLRKHKSFKRLVPSGYTGIDIKSGRNVDMVVKPYNWPFMDEFFDIVISGSTLEHVERFWDIIVEMARVLKRGGKMCVIAPFIWEEHHFPVDCWRFLPDGMKVLADISKLTLLDSYIVENTCIGIFSK